MNSNYFCKIASLNELINKCDYEIKKHPNNNMWIVFKNRAVKNYKEGNTIVYIGILDNEIICDATAYIKTDAFKGDIANYDGLLTDEMVYLSGFRTNKEYESKGYFSKLFKFMQNDLKKRGYKKISLGVEPCEIRNIQIYFKWGFTNYLKTTIEYLPSKDEKSLEITVNYYYKEIA